MICAGVEPMFSSVNVPWRSSMRSPSDVTTADGWTVKMMFVGAEMMLTLFVSDGGPLLVGSQAGIARTRWYTVPVEPAMNDAAVELVTCESRIEANDGDVDRSTR